MQRLRAAGVTEPSRFGETRCRLSSAGMASARRPRHRAARHQTRPPLTESAGCTRDGLERCPSRQRCIRVVGRWSDQGSRPTSARSRPSLSGSTGARVDRVGLLARGHATAVVAGEPAPTRARCADADGSGRLERAVRRADLDGRVATAVPRGVWHGRRRPPGRRPPSRDAGPASARSGSEGKDPSGFDDARSPTYCSRRCPGREEGTPTRWPVPGAAPSRCRRSTSSRGTAQEPSTDVPRRAGRKAALDGEVREG